MISVRQAFLKGALLRFVVYLPSTYPDTPPSVEFQTSVQCLLISADGLLDLGEFEPWDRDALCSRGGMPLLAILRYIKQILYRPPPKDAAAVVLDRHSVAVGLGASQVCRSRFASFEWHLHGDALRQMGCRSLVAASVIQKHTAHWLREIRRRNAELHTVR